MKWTTIALAATALVSALAPSALAATAKAKYTCETDADCETNFPGTVCIEVANYGDPVFKCTPNTKKRPACRGAQPGLCPSFQPADIGYLNVQCVFVAADDSLSIAASGSASASASGSVGSGSGKKKRRFLALAAATTKPAANATNATTATTKAPATASTSADGSATGDVVVPSGDGSSTTVTATKAGKYAKVKIGKETVTGQFMCVDVSDCENQAYDKTVCFPSTCGPTNSLTQCNNHGTCTYPSVQTMKRRTCMCYAGYGGTLCEKEISNACDVDCGYGGDCVDGTCSCKKGYDGKAYKGKQGKPNQRCTKCTNDLACQNGNSCDTETGTCVCGAGYGGPTCGATEDSCVKKDCGKGNCRPATNGSAVCYCPVCLPDCQICTDKDCASCPSPASTLALSTPLAVATALVAMAVAHFDW